MHGVYQLPYTTERGTTCCIRMPDPRHGDDESNDHPRDGENGNSNGNGNSNDDGRDRYLLVGVSHVKIPHWEHVRRVRGTTGADFGTRQYMSRFYAFDPSPPYPIVSVSGRFCLPLPDTDDDDDVHPYTRYVLDRNIFRFNHTHLDCPMISFVTTMVEAIDDPSSVIIGYGTLDSLNPVM